MQLFWHGYSCIRIETKSLEHEVTILTDPYEGEASLRFPRTVVPDILLLSHQDVKRFNMENVQNPSFIIANPGEYEVKGVFMQVIQDKTQEIGEKFRPLIYRIVSEGISVAYLGQIKRRLTAYELEQLDAIDILFLPVGGGEVMDAKVANDTISDIEPRMVVPIHFDLPGIKTKLASVDSFCKTMGVCKRQDMNKLKIVKKDLPAEDMLVTVLERV